MNGPLTVRGYMSESKRGYARVAGVAFLVILGCAQGAADGKAAGPGDVTVGPENVVVVAEAELASGPWLSGQLVAERAASLRAEVASSVVEVVRNQGDRVEAGELLARLDDAAIRDAWLSARSGVTSAQTAADQAARDLARAERLLAAGAVADRDVEAARNATLAAQAILADARARLALAQKQLDACTVKAPFAGVVGERQVSAGDIVAPGTPLFTVLDPSSMRLEAAISAASLGEVRVGMPVRFTITGYAGRTFAGRVTNVNPEADPLTGQVRIYVAIPNPGGQLVGGLYAQGRVASATHRVPSAPLAAVDQRGLRPYVVRLRGGTVERVEVTLGIRDDDGERVEIAAGVAVGDTLLLGAAQGITVGTAVRVRPAADTARRS